jgi:formylglycine-generating enzyme required for sulfatase activity/predicted Ser/Thr protein kinase
MLTPNTVLQNRYRIIKQIGLGGMGAVYLALDQRFSRCSKVAIKEFFFTKEKLRKAFEQEAWLLNQLKHPALPRVTDYFSENDNEFLVMEYISGEDLWEMINRDVQFSVGEVLSWADQLLDALDYLHTQQEEPIIHRDIKPHNIKLMDNNRVVLIDFGAAKGGIGGDMYDFPSMSIVGFTPNYAPLEQSLRRDEVTCQTLRLINPRKLDEFLSLVTDPRSDLYSLAATLYHLLTRKVPAAASLRVVAHWLGNPDPLEFASTINPDIPFLVSEVLQEALALEPANRIQTARQMRAALQMTFSSRSIPEFDSRPSLLTGELHKPLIDPTEKQLKGKSKQDVFLPMTSPLPIVKERDEIEFANTTQVDIALAQTAVNEDVVFDDSTMSDSEKTDPLNTEPLSNNPNNISKNAGHPFYQGFQQHVGAKVIGAVLTVIFLWGAGFIGFFIFVSKQLPQKQTASVLEVKKPSDEPQKSAIPMNIPKTPDGMVYVSGGSMQMGRNDGDKSERPAHDINVKSFYIDRTEVTREEFAKCVVAGRCSRPEGWTSDEYPEGTGRLPVTGVTWDDASAYANFVGKRLPTEAEWEFAAKGQTNFIYPWGNEWKQGMANANGASRTLTEVGMFKGESEFGVVDIIGNAWEWTADTYKPYAGKMPDEFSVGEFRVIRGGAWDIDRRRATATFRYGWPARKSGNYGKVNIQSVTYSYIGFRCVKDVE